MGTRRIARYPHWRTKHSTRCHIMENKCVPIFQENMLEMQTSEWIVGELRADKRLDNSRAIMP